MGGVAQPPLAAAVSEAGGLGVLGLYRHAESEIEQLVEQTAKLTRRRFGVNFVTFVLDEAELRARVALVASLRAKPIITFFGLPSEDLAKLASEKTECGVQVGSVEEARRALEMGASFAVVQTAEAGGHHLGTLSFETAAAALRERGSRGASPVFLSGGIGAPGDLERALENGFAGVLCGTIFAAATESSAHPLYKARIVAATPDDTVITDAFSIGWHTHRHRVIRNRTCDKSAPATMIGSVMYFGRSYPLPRYSVAVPTDFTTGRIEEMALYCGTSCAAVDRVRPAAEIVRAFGAAL